MCEPSIEQRSCTVARNMNRLLPFILGLLPLSAFAYAPAPKVVSPVSSPLLKAVNYGGNSSPWIARTMDYDFLNRLRQITTQAGDAHNYEFDALNRRQQDTLGDGSRFCYQPHVKVNALLA